MTDELLKDDPLKKPKKITLLVFVSVLILIMISVFASFHWICTDYFYFRANKKNAQRELEEVRARCIEEESVSKVRLAEMEKRMKGFEQESSKKIKNSELEAQERIKTAEEEAKSRIEVLEGEYTKKRDSLVKEYEKLEQELAGGLAAKKSDIALLLRGHMERFSAKTNDFEIAISRKREELVELKQMIAVLPDLMAQVVAASNAMVVARQQRDVALESERNSQEIYNKWNAKVVSAKTVVAELEDQKNKVLAELQKLQSQTNEAHIAIGMLNGEISVVNTKIVTAKEEFKDVEKSITNAYIRLEGVKKKIELESKRLADVEIVRGEAEKARDTAIEKKREAEKARDKIVMESALKEEQWNTRKAEIESLLKDLNKILEMKSKSVKESDDTVDGRVK